MYITREMNKSQFHKWRVTTVSFLRIITIIITQFKF